MAGLFQAIPVEYESILGYVGKELPWFLFSSST